MKQLTPSTQYPIRTDVSALREQRHGLLDQLGMIEI